MKLDKVITFDRLNFSKLFLETEPKGFSLKAKVVTAPFTDELSAEDMVGMIKVKVVMHG